jgi:hypothetical protein
MIHKSHNLIQGLVVTMLLFTSTCTLANTGPLISAEIVLVGSTPGDVVIKSMLSIAADKKVDFVRWDLVLNENSRSYVLNGHYGVGKPNTPDFEGGGEKLRLSGTYKVSKDRNCDVYRLEGDKVRGTTIALAKLNDDLFHILSPEGKLMVGTGGWSHTLTRKGAIAASPNLPRWTTTAPVAIGDKTVFVGRTPCREVAGEYDLASSSECYKLKWKLTLLRDPQTKEPASYKLEYTLHRSSAIEGKWSIVSGTKANPQAIVYQLDPDKPGKAISLLVGDENVLFFMDKQERLFSGNADFSYTLSKSDR